MKRRFPWLLLPLVVLGLDWVSKWAILARFQPGEVKPVIAGFFNLTLGFNPGAIFGFLSEAHAGLRTAIFILASLVAIIYFGRELLKAETPTLQRWALGLILGGALGNSLDRLVHGHVVDFLDFILFGWHYWTFNLADSAIVCGAVLLGISLFRGRER
ncbi:MAG: signal peptidase II [Firmicutes bacterium]|nr:signal peptidase II [Bacillota bacterium]